MERKVFGGREGYSLALTMDVRTCNTIRLRWYSRNRQTVGVKCLPAIGSVVGSQLEHQCCVRGSQIYVFMMVAAVCKVVLQQCLDQHGSCLYAEQ